MRRNKIFTPHQILLGSNKEEIGGECSAHGEMRNEYKYLVRKAYKEETIWKTWLRWEDNIRIDLREMGLGMWIGYIWLRIGIGGTVL
jgi:hypothetical protein